MLEATDFEFKSHDSTQRRYIRVNTAIDLLSYLSELFDCDCPTDSSVFYHVTELEKALKQYLCREYSNGLKEVEAQKERRLQEKKRIIALCNKKRHLLDELEKIGELENTSF